MIAQVQTADGAYTVDLDDESIVAVDADGSIEAPAPVSVSLPRVVAAAGAGSTVAALVDAKPPLLVSHDGGRTWRESGRGLPAGRAVAVADDDPDVVLFAARNRLYLSTDGGRFWRALGLELPEIEAVSL